MNTDDVNYLKAGGIDAKPARKLPILALLALALSGFITILTETLPAGLLLQIGDGLDVSESLAGQLITIYAIGSLIAAIPLMTITQGLRRRPLLLAAIVGFGIANTITTLSTSYVLTMIARFLAGVAAGLLWALLAGYAARMVPDHLKGRAIAIAMVGTPLALSLGVPAGTFLGTLLGWRASFGIMSLLALIVFIWVSMKVPDFPGQPITKRLTLRQTFTIPGIRPVLFVVLAFVLAHNILYSYIAPFLASADMSKRTDLVLLVFGITALIGISVIGLLIDRHLRALTLASTFFFGLAALILGIADDLPIAIYVAVGTWGISFGGVATLFQTALAQAAGEAADIAQSMLVTAWNLAIAGGAIIGAVLLDRFGPGSFSPAILVLLTATLLVVSASRQHGFPTSKLK